MTSFFFTCCMWITKDDFRLNVELLRLNFIIRGWNLKGSSGISRDFGTRGFWGFQIKKPSVELSWKWIFDLDRFPICTDTTVASIDCRTTLSQYLGVKGQRLYHAQVDITSTVEQIVATLSWACKQEKIQIAQTGAGFLSDIRRNTIILNKNLFQFDLKAC